MEKSMRIVWKEKVEYKEYKYRKHYIRRYAGGWETDIEGDDNIYLSIECAENAIDKMLGGDLKTGSKRRKGKGIRIIGSKLDIAQ